MDTHTESTQPPAALFSPMAGWEAASRWNAATLDWMARGFQQWVALLTVIPPHPELSVRPIAAAQAGTISERPQATASPRRSTPPKRAAPRTKAPRGSKPRASAKG